jgi:hypothetical protein
MTRWIAIAAAAGFVCLALSPAKPAIAASRVAAPHQPSAQADDFSARRRHRPADRLRHPSYEPHYYVRPTYYRPYPYGAPYPFMFGFGPW